MTTALRRATGLILAGLFAVACGGSPAATIPATAAPTLAPGQTPVLVPDQPLEDLFPDTIGGNTVDVQSAQGASVLSLFGNSEPAQFNEFLTAIGTTIDKVSAAYTFGIWPGATDGEFTGLTMIALRARDIPAATTMQNLQTLVKEDVADDATITPGTVAGKQVITIADPEDPENVVHLYGIGDIVFMVGGTPAYVEEAVGQLP